MKILFTIHYFLPEHQAGTEIYSYKLAKELSRKHDVHLFYSETDFAREQYSLTKKSFDGMPVYEVINNQQSALFEESYSNKTIDSIFEEILDEVQPDIVHIQHAYNLSTNMAQIAKKRGIPVVYTLHEFWLICPKGGQRLKENLDLCSEINPRDCARCIAGNFPDTFLSKLAESLSKKLNPIYTSVLDLCDVNAVVKAPGKELVKPGLNYECDDIINPILFAHPQSKVTFKICIPNDAILHFTILMFDDTYDTDGCAARFTIKVDDKTLFTEIIDPKRIPEDRGWNKRQLDLSEFGNRKIRLSFITESVPKKHKVHGTSAWGNPTLVYPGSDDGKPPTTMPKKWMRSKAVADTLNNFAYSRKFKVSFKAVEKRLEHVRKLFNEVDLFISPSKFLRDEFVKFGLSEKKIIFSDNGYDTSLFSKTYISESPIVRFAYIGTVLPHKGLHVLVDAFSGIDEKKAELNIYGQMHANPQYRDSVYTKAKGKSNIHFKGRFENERVDEIFWDTDVLVVPSIWYENSPLTIHEAFMSGTPVIASDHGGMAEYVKHGVNGLLFETGNPLDLREKINSLLNGGDQSEILKCGTTPVKTIEEDALDLEARYRKLVNKPLPRVSRENITNPVAVLIPTLNAGSEFESLLIKLSRQKYIQNMKIVIVDSGSTDGTLETAKDFGVSLISIPSSEFNHGLTRNLAAEYAKDCDFFVFLTQDALPVSDYLVHDLVNSFKSDPKIVAVTSRQVPRSDADLFACWSMYYHYKFLGFTKNVVMSSLNVAELPYPQKRQSSQLDDVCTAYRKDYFFEHKFKELPFAEDLDFGYRAVKDGKKLLYCHDAAVIHSHNRAPEYIFKRCYVDSLILPGVLQFKHPVIHSRGMQALLMQIVGLNNAIVNAIEETDFSADDPLPSFKACLKKQTTKTAADISCKDSPLGKILRELIRVYPLKKSDYRGSARNILLNNYLINVDVFRSFTVDRPLGGQKDDVTLTLFKLLANVSGTHIGTTTYYNRIESIDKILSKGV